jgi:hypothetical protein
VCGILIGSKPQYGENIGSVGERWRCNFERKIMEVLSNEISEQETEIECHHCSSLGGQQPDQKKQ